MSRAVPEVASSPEFAAPYKRSWVDALLSRIEALPGPTWVPYVIATAIIAVVGTGLSWIDGSQEPGTFSFIRVYNDVYTLYPLAVIHYLTVTARRSLEAFRPALGDLEADYPTIQYRFTTMPLVMVLVALVIGTAYTVSSLVLDPAITGITDRTSLPNVIYLSAVGLIAGATFVLLLFFIVRLGALVVRVSAGATGISLYEAATHSAFARLTLRASIGLTLPIYIYNFYVIVAGNPRDGISFSDALAVAAMVAVGIAVFLIPLAGMHRRLVDEKSRLQTEVNRRFELATREVHRRADAGTLEGIGELNTLLGALVTERDTLKKMSTWPWEAETLRGFLSSVALPILLWFVTNFLGRILGT